MSSFIPERRLFIPYKELQQSALAANIIKNEIIIILTLILGHLPTADFQIVFPLAGLFNICPEKTYCFNG